MKVKYIGHDFSQLHRDILERVTFQLRPLAPFRLDLTAWVLRRRPENIVDRFDGRVYRRLVTLDKIPLEVAVTQGHSTGKPRLAIEVEGTHISPDTKERVKSLLDVMLGLHLDINSFYRQITHDSKIGDLTRRFRGFRPPRFPSVFEALVNAVACQQVSLTVGIILLGRLVQTFGTSMRLNDSKAYAFPLPEEIAELDQKDLRKLGFSMQKSRALIELSSSIASHSLDLEKVNAMDDEGAIEYLSQIRGIGRWSAEYVLLRGLGRLNIFPGDDVGARNKLQTLLRLRRDLDYGAVKRITEKWKPYEGLVYFHMLLDWIDSNGYLVSGDRSIP